MLISQDIVAVHRAMKSGKSKQITFLVHTFVEY